MSVKRIFVEKKQEFAVSANGVNNQLIVAFPDCGVTNVRLFNRYDVENISDEDFDYAVKTVLSEPQIDNTSSQLPKTEGYVLAVEYLPGQFDQRADSAAVCIQLFTQKERPIVKNAKIYIIEGNISSEYKEKIKKYIINPVESREASMELPKTLADNFAIPTEVEILNGFNALDENGLNHFISDRGLAMDIDDIKCCQKYFKETEKREPTVTEIKMIDTYWSDHCRHTTFSTHIDDVKIENDEVKASFDRYVSIRNELGRTNKPITLMDIATIGAKYLKKTGKLQDLDESEEINACSVKIKVDHDGVSEDWLLMFKNETHNHPTEIEPFGGAATCLGGAIRDPLSGRSYVYQAMRVSGAGNPLTPLSETIKGKLPQSKITSTAAQGYSSYGNQIGLAAGQVSEIYHDGYVAKRLEAGAVIAAAPAENVIREVPEAGDLVILLGGKTGRDGCGGATGSSKSHTVESLTACGAEVQKGNAPEERKIQRLFRNGEATKLIRRCNDFGAGGVAVAIGELADGLDINLDLVPKKYDGLDGTELAISESQERMAVVVRSKDMDKFMELAHNENLSAIPVARVTDKNRLVMSWNEDIIVDLSRDFLNSNGADKHINVVAKAPEHKATTLELLDIETKWLENVQKLNVCSQKGIIERFDTTVGMGTVLMPYGGKHQLTPTQAMCAKIPVRYGDTTTCSLMSWGFNPEISSLSPYNGAKSAVIESVAKLVATGGTRKKCWLSFQEFFEKLGRDEARWGKPFQALLGGLDAQLALEVGAIGGKDSMSGTFEHINVPPTLISFAVSTANTNKVISPEFKKANSNVYYISPKYNEDMISDLESVKEVMDKVEKLIADGKALSVWTVGVGGISAGITKMAVGNGIGFEFAENKLADQMFNPVYGAFIIEAANEISGETLLGKTISEYKIVIEGKEISMDDVQKLWENKLEPIFPTKIPTPKIIVPTVSYNAKEHITTSIKIAKPKVLLPVFPGTNCEYDVARAFEREGAETEIFVVNNLTPENINESVKAFEKLLKQSQIVAIPGGFSGGDEPDGSAKFIISFFRNPLIKEAVRELLQKRDGLMCGICNGFQALIKLGLVPYGDIVETDENSPTITFNTIGRHQSGLSCTRIASNKSPWLMHTNVGDLHTVAISHGEGRFVMQEEELQRLIANGQIATQYVDLNGNPTMDIRYNPNGSLCAVEGITSPDGRVFGKMAHSERFGSNIFQNVDGNKDEPIFKGAVDYFTK
ncbi:MAG: phosphoribosylformylglycinamidine synthase [Oscillospiraceae bacterium]